MEREIKDQNDLSILVSFLNMEEVIYQTEMNSQMHRAYADIALLKSFLMDPPQEFVKDGTLELFNSLASKVVSIIFPLDLNTVATKLHHIHLNSHLYDLMSKGQNYVVRPKLSRIYPMIGQLEFVDHLVENLKELVISKEDSIAPLKFLILKFIEALQFLSSHLMVMSQEQKDQPHLHHHLLKTIADSAYEIEWIIDSFMIRKFAIWYYMSSLIDELETIQNWEAQIRIESGDMQQIVSTSIEFSLPGFELVIYPLVQARHEKFLEYFNHDLVVTSCEVRTWCVCSSYKERKKEVFLQLLNNASYQPDVANNDKISYTSDMSQDELEISLRELLINKKSFIILEDVQNNDILHDIIRVFPNPGYSGRILLASHSPEFAVQCGYTLQKVLWNRYSQEYTSESVTNVRSTECDGGDVVGFKEEIETMLELLTNGQTKRNLISIFGMAGLGKTTLAKKLFNDPLVIKHFDTRAWCYVSQVYETKKLLLELLGQIVQRFETICDMDEGELSDLLRKSLLGRRFLIVLDDMWSTEAWNDLRRCFPNEKSGSRIIFTTRLQHLASQAQFDSIIQPLGYLSENESWELLRKKVFEKQSFPEELSEVGTRIAERCKGLPFSVILVAGVLVKTEKTKDRWTQILESLNSSILGDVNDHGKGIIEMSYTHLPEYLKSCFLYLGQFFRGREIGVTKLIRMLIAEGLIKHTNELKSLENVAEDFLIDLIGRSLVTVSHEKSNGGVKSCRVHDLIHEFCLTKAEEEKFLQQIHGYNEHFLSSDNYEDYGMDPNDIYSSEPIIYDLRRICIYSKRNHFIMLKPSGREVRSLSFFPASDTHPNYPYDISFISHNFKYLIKLNLEDTNIGESFNALMVLVHLRYLAVQGYVDCIPSSISNLWKLETFLVKGLKARVVEVPDAICGMGKLRHVHIHESASFKLNPDRSENLSILDNLQTLSTPILTYGGDMEKILRRVKGIKKLKCIFLESYDDTMNCNKLPRLGFLSQLVSLKVSFDGVRKSLCEFDFPSKLTKLTLLKFRKSWSEISQLARLNNLEVLKLLNNAVEGEIWNMGEDEVFSKLKFLKLDTLDIVEWIIEGDNFPLLEHLILNKCEQLEEIPPSIGDITTMNMIEVLWCKESVAISAREIHDEQMQYSNVVKIHIHPNSAS